MTSLWLDFPRLFFCTRVIVGVPSRPTAGLCTRPTCWDWLARAFCFEMLFRLLPLALFRERPCSRANTLTIPEFESTGGPPFCLNRNFV